jgi:hypothetical protein
MEPKSLVAATLLTLSGYAFAQDGERTLALLPEDAELPDVVTAAIDLPKDEDGEYRPSVKAVESSADGIRTANAAREDGRAFGASMAAEAKENRELRARGGPPDFGDLLPEQVPDDVSLPTRPERPELPQPPEQPVTPPVTPPAPPGRP